MAIIALTGGIGSGKSEAANIFAGLGVPIVDTDVIAHTLTAPNQAAIAPIQQVFGANFIQADGALNRTKMRQHVFANPEEKVKLEQIMHPLIRQQVKIEVTKNKLIIHEAGSLIHYQMVVIPLLFESSDYQTFADINVVVDCDPALQMQRAMARSQLTESAVLSIMNAQIAREKRLELADEVIKNEGTINELTAKINNLHAKLNSFCFRIINNTNHLK